MDMHDEVFHVDFERRKATILLSCTLFCLLICHFCFSKQDVELIGARSAALDKEGLELGRCWPDDLVETLYFSLFFNQIWVGACKLGLDTFLV